MDTDSSECEIFKTKGQFKSKSEAEKLKILEGKDKASTQKVTVGAVKQLKEYSLVKKLPKIDELSTDELSNVPHDFYPVIKPQNLDDYSFQSLKCIRSGLARHFRTTKGINISKDSEFMKANEMFKVVTVHSKNREKE